MPREASQSSSAGSELWRQDTGSEVGEFDQDESAAVLTAMGKHKSDNIRSKPSVPTPSATQTRAAEGAKPGVM